MFLPANLFGRTSKCSRSLKRFLLKSCEECSCAAGHHTQLNSSWTRSMLIQLCYILIWIKYLWPASILTIRGIFIGLLSITSVVAVMVGCRHVLLFGCAFPLSVHPSSIALLLSWQNKITGKLGPTWAKFAFCVWLGPESMFMSPFTNHPRCWVNSVIALSLVSDTEVSLLRSKDPAFLEVLADASMSCQHRNLH